MVGTNTGHWTLLHSTIFKKDNGLTAIESMTLARLLAVATRHAFEQAAPLRKNGNARASGEVRICYRWSENGEDRAPICNPWRIEKPRRLTSSPLGE